MQFYQNLKKIRNQHNESQKNIADVLNTTQQQYWKYEKGEQEIPTRHVITLAKHYNITTDEILGLTTTNIILSDEVKHVIEIYNILSDKRKGKLELFLEQLAEQQEEEQAQRKEVA